MQSSSPLALTARRADCVPRWPQWGGGARKLWSGWSPPPSEKPGVGECARLREFSGIALLSSSVARPRASPTSVPEYVAPSGDFPDSVHCLRVRLAKRASITNGAPDAPTICALLVISVLRTIVSRDRTVRALRTAQTARRRTVFVAAPVDEHLARMSWVLPCEWISWERDEGASATSGPRSILLSTNANRLPSASPAHLRARQYDVRPVDYLV